MDEAGDILCYIICPYVNREGCYNYCETIHCVFELALAILLYDYLWVHEVVWIHVGAHPLWELLEFWAHGRSHVCPTCSHYIFSQIMQGTFSSFFSYKGLAYQKYKIWRCLVLCASTSQGSQNVGFHPFPFPSRIAPLVYFLEIKYHYCNPLKDLYCDTMWRYLKILGPFV